jgi:transposase
MRHLFKVYDEYPKLGECFALKKEFRKLFDIGTKEDAAAFIEYFKELVEESGIPELQSFNQTFDHGVNIFLTFITIKSITDPQRGLII